MELDFPTDLLHQHSTVNEMIADTDGMYRK